LTRKLPIAIAASTLPAASSTATAASAWPASSPSATSAVAATPSATASTFLLRPSFVHDQRAPQKILSVQTFDCFHSFGIVCNFCETESARLIRKTISQQCERIGLNSNFREHCGDLFFRCFKR
jgi:hypothetical protein